VVVDDLLGGHLECSERAEEAAAYKEIVFCVFEHHIDELVLQDNFLQRNDVFMRNLAIQLRDAEHASIDLGASHSQRSL
jgi:hypothetical protein